MSLPAELDEELQRVGDDVDAVLEAVLTDSEANTVFTTHVGDSLVFFGKSLATWDDELAVPLPENGIDPDSLQDIWIVLANNIQIASHFYELSSAAHAVSADSVEVKKADLIVAIVAHFHSQSLKTPPAIVLEKMADGYVKRLKNLGNTAKIVKMFWKGKLKMLEDVKSIVNSIAISMAVVAKHAGASD